MSNFAVDVVEAAPTDRLAIVELARDGARREWSFGAVAQAARTLAAQLHFEHGVQRGDTVLTLVGNQPGWVSAMVACFRQGYVVLPCNEQLREKDLALRLAACPPRPWSATSATSRCCARPAGRDRRSGFPAGPVGRPPLRRRPPPCRRSIRA